MESVVIVIHLLVVAAMVVVVLLQRSEGGALGIGGGGAGGGFLTGRSAANLLTRTTAILATIFFGTSLVLGILSGMKNAPSDLLDNVPVEGNAETQGTDNGLLDELNKISPNNPLTAPKPTGPQVPTSE